MQALAGIAAALCVSTNTVKTHVRSINAKLGVPSRRTAVAAARAQGIAGFVTAGSESPAVGEAHARGMSQARPFVTSQGGDRRGSLHSL